METISIESLHSELIVHICRYLDETHPASLLSFARASKNCYDIASSFLFRTIKLTVSNGQQLAQNSQKWETLLRREGGFRHVRRLILHWAENLQDMRHDKYTSLAPCDRYEDDSELKTCWDLYEDVDIASTESCATNDDWELFARLMKQCTGLADLLYACPAQPPPCVLQTLHTYLPRCRLHNYTFRLRTLSQQVIDPNGVAVAHSPSLYSIGEFTHTNQPLVWDFVRRHAGQLKEARICPPEDEAADFEGNRGCACETRTEMRSPVPLEVFHLKPSLQYRPLSFRTVSWAMGGNFSALRVLRLDVAVTNLDALPASADFPALVTLVFTCAKRPEMEYWSRLLTFLHDLPLLTTLELREWHRSVSVVPGLNRNLRKLHFFTRVDNGADPLRDDHIRRLADVCPDLEDLALEVRRSRGNACEVSLYRALGRLRRLQYLAIISDASPPPLNNAVEFLDSNGDSISYGTSVEPWFDAEDAKTANGPLCPYRQGHIHDVLVNSAIDECLAHSIFVVINKEKAGLSGSVLQLERLKIHASYGEKFPRTEVTGLPEYAKLLFTVVLHRIWLVERDVRDDARDVLHVTEIGMKSSLDSGRAIDLDTRLIASEGDDFYDVWQRIWPSKVKGTKWWESWEISPLDLKIEKF